MSRLLNVILVLACILFLPLLTTSAQPVAGCVESGADVAAALAAAQTSASRCLHVPAGTYQLSTQLNGTADGLTITGDGIGRTIVQTQPLTLTANYAAFQLTGTHQTVEDLTIAIGSGYAGAFEVVGVSIYDGAMYSTVARVEVVGGYSSNGANGAGIATYAPWSHSGANQYALIQDCSIHDSPTTGLRINSNGNTIRGNRIERVGATLQQHGIYAQGGYNLYDSNTVIQASGYSFHGWKKVQGIDGSGDVWRDNVSIDPGFQHMIVSGLTSNGTNPAIPNGKQLTRSVTITSNLFRNTGSIKRTGLLTDVPAVIIDNTFEDVVADGSGPIRISPTAGGSIVRNNAIRAFQPAASNGTGIKVDAPALVDGNAIDTRGLSAAIGGSPAGVVLGANLIYTSAP